jgi:hypothetical protein
VVEKREEVTGIFWRGSEWEFTLVKMSRLTPAATADYSKYLLP